jgi:hypothetical protein
MLSSKNWIITLNSVAWGRWCGFFSQEMLEHYVIYMSGHESVGQPPYTVYVCPAGWDIDNERVRWDTYIGGKIGDGLSKINS